MMMEQSMLLFDDGITSEMFQTVSKRQICLYPAREKKQILQHQYNVAINKTIIVGLQVRSLHLQVKIWQILNETLLKLGLLASLCLSAHLSINNN
jgi:hypothetical protein